MNNFKRHLDEAFKASKNADWYIMNASAWISGKPAKSKIATEEVEYTAEEIAEFERTVMRESSNKFKKTLEKIK